MALCAFALLSLLVGLLRPVLVLWFLDRFNRRKVISFYGKFFLLALLLLILAQSMDV